MGKSDHIILEFLISRQRKAKGSQMCMLDFRKAFLMAYGKSGHIQRLEMLMDKQPKRDRIF